MNNDFKLHKQFLANRAKNFARHRKRWKDWKRVRNRRYRSVSKLEREELSVKDKYSDYVWIKPPSSFSMITNTEDSLAFISKLERCFGLRQKVFVNLSEVKIIAHGALVVLLSIMKKFKANNIGFNGYMPKDPLALRILKESGFFSELYCNKSHSLESYRLEKPYFFTHSSKIVDQQLSASLIESMSKLIWGEPRRCTKLQRVYIELMQNTNNHASLEGHGQQHWWTTAIYDRERNTGCFSFIDYGVGILKSLKNDHRNKFFAVLEKITQIFKPRSNADLLKLLMTGEIHRTASGAYYRGKGLPGIYQACENNNIAHLVVISNDTICNFANNSFTLLKNKFSGTFVYWELTATNNNFAIKAV